MSGKLSPVLVEVGVGVGLPATLVLFRIFFIPWIDDGAPFAQVFVAVVGAAVLAGWRSGLIALITGQALSWIYVIEPRGVVGPADPSQWAALLLATGSQLIALVIIALYQREVDRAWSRRESQIDLLEKALNEIDHRTSNNYQTVLALVLAQARSSDGEVRDALQQVADRIRAIADAQRRLGVTSISLEQVMVGEHLRDLCANLRRGLTRPGVELHCHFVEMPLGADETVCISILVNELVTNALKHAFPGDRAGAINVALRRTGRTIDLTVEDDGVGMNANGSSHVTGLGSRLVDTFVRQLKARHDVVTTDSGTRHRIRIPARR